MGAKHDKLADAVEAIAQRLIERSPKYGEEILQLATSKLEKSGTAVQALASIGVVRGSIIDEIAERIVSDLNSRAEFKDRFATELREANATVGAPEKEVPSAVLQGAKQLVKRVISEARDEDRQTKELAKSFDGMSLY
jgi:hypothetical protein